MFLAQHKILWIYYRSTSLRKLIKCDPHQWVYPYQQQLRSCEVSFDLKKPDIPTITHNDGTVAPQLAFGTWKLHGEKCEEAVSTALTYGYRYIDTAYMYRNEVEIGKAIKSQIEGGKIKREDIYISTKLWNIHHRPECVEHALRLSLANLCLNYVDLYLMHWPIAFEYKGDDELFPLDCSRKLQMSLVNYVDTWKAMEKLVEKGLTKSIGVSNFNSEQLARLMASSKIIPVQNQIEVSPIFSNAQLIEFCKERCIVVSGHSPYAAINPEKETPKFFYDFRIKDMVKHHKKTKFQIVIRFLIDKGIIPIVRSSVQDHIIDNIEIFDFKLTSKDTYFLEKYNIGQRVISFESAQHSPYYPFSIPF